MTATSPPVPEPQEEIDRRLARFNMTRHARDLWPDVPLPVFRAAERELGRVASAVLRDAPSPVVLRWPASGARALGVAAFAGGVGALMGYWCETGRIAAEPGVADLLAIHLHHGRRRLGRLREELERVAGALAERGIDVCLLKGMHTAYRYFPEPGSRVSSDIDLLVRPDDWLAACDVLRGLGLVETRNPSHPRVSSWGLPGSQTVPTLAYAHANAPWSIDMHWSLDRVPFAGLETGLGTPDASASEVWEEFCRPVRILAQPLLLTYLALHASSHFYAVSQLRLIELVLVARRDFADRAEPWERFADLVARTGSGRFVFPALDLAERFVPGTFDGRVLGRIANAAPRRLRRLVRRMAPATAQRLHPYPGLRERFVWLATVGEWLAAVGWLVRPRDSDNAGSPARAVVAQWRRIQRTLRRIVHARTS